MSLEALTEALRKEKLTFGTRETLRKLGTGKAHTIFLAVDCKEEIRKKISYYATLGKITVHELKQKSHEIAHICKKNYPVSVISY